MNKQINELIEKAFDKSIPYTWDSLDYIEVEKLLSVFADLIVRECAELTLDHKGDDYYNGWLDYRDEIKRHFGVEQ
jgi:hypothetical protein